MYRAKGHLLDTALNASLRLHEFINELVTKLRASPSPGNFVLVVVMRVVLAWFDHRPSQSIRAASGSTPRGPPRVRANGIRGPPMELAQTFLGKPQSRLNMEHIMNSHCNHRKGRTLQEAWVTGQRVPFTGVWADQFGRRVGYDKGETFAMVQSNLIGPSGKPLYVCGHHRLTNFGQTAA